MKTPCGARTRACRVHTRVNARKSLKRCSQECEHGTQKCVRHDGMTMGLRPAKDDECAKWGGPPGPALRVPYLYQQADEGVGCWERSLRIREKFSERARLAAGSVCPTLSYKVEQALSPAV
jgi:hypothetical protein